MLGLNTRWKALMLKFFCCLIPPEKLQEQIDQEKIGRQYRQITRGENSFFYPESLVENFTGDRSRIQIGYGTHIRGELTLFPGTGVIEIGNHSFIGKWSVVRANKRISIGDHVMISHHVTIIDSDSHEIDYIARADSFQRMFTSGVELSSKVATLPIVIEDHAWISYNVAILKGVRVGRGAIIGAGSVVTKDIPPFCIAVGNPARVVRENI